MSIVTLLTDFGTADGYVAAMKGVILAQRPDAQIIDATHEIPAHNIREGAWALRHYWKLFPEGAIHIAVVDPGVGSKRRPLIARADGRWLIGPDNGVFSWVFRESRRWEARALKSKLRRPDAIGNTFHGRDVFAYAAGKLASGSPINEVAGARITPVLFDWPRPFFGKNKIRGDVIHIDRFGNAITNISASALERIGTFVEIECEKFRAERIRKFYSEVAVEEPVALIESTGLLELALCEGNAAAKFDIKIGSHVLIKKA
jgi:S-adenosylmethionine hydrolase